MDTYDPKVFCKIPQKQGEYCIAVKSSVPQGMFVCFDKGGWLVCRNSSDTEGVGRV
jgi:hypothetical protein